MATPEEQLDELRRRQQSHLLEYRRQFRGLLAMIRAILRRTAHTDLSVEDYAQHLEGRLAALSRVQDMLMRVPDAGADLMELVSGEFLAQGIPDERIELKGPSVPLSGKFAASLALALHELTTNAIKFGALSASHGRVLVRWRADQRDGNVQLEWREEGVPIKVPACRAVGFGMELIETTLPYELGARTSLNFAPAGLCCLIDFRAAQTRAGLSAASHA